MALADPPPVLTPTRPMLRVLACGSVDDGKSTLLGRLIHDAAGLYADQAPADDDFAGLFDGLEAEREQGITIDVAYRYFATAARKFIVVDTPGHEQYTRNMVTGASNGDLAVMLVDATQGITRQTRRHSRIVRLLGLSHVVLAVNKLDLLDFSEARFTAIVDEYRALAQAVGLERFEAVPLAAKHGDNVAVKSARTPWYRGPTLLALLEDADVHDAVGAPFVMPVQAVTRTGQRHRWLAGSVASGAAAVGDALRILPGGRRVHVAAVLDADEASAGRAVSLRLVEEVDCARGDVLAAEGAGVVAADRVTADLVWFGEQPLQPGLRYLLKLGHRTTGGRVLGVRDVFDPETGAHGPARTVLANDIAVAELRLDAVLATTSFALGPVLGGFILIDPATHATVAAGLIRETSRGSAPGAASAYRIAAPAEKRLRVAQRLSAALVSQGRRPVLVDEALLAELTLAPADDAAVGALVRLLEQAGATPVLMLGEASTIGSLYDPGDDVQADPDWVI